MPSTIVTFFGAAAVALALAASPAFGQQKQSPKATTAAKPDATPAAAAPAGTPQLVLQSKDWSAITAAPAKGKMCYAIAKPEKLEPDKLNHGDVFFFVSTRPSEKVTNEPSIQVGYALKEQSTVNVDVDGQKFVFFTQGDGAWLRDKADEQKFVEVLKKGRRMQVAAVSGRGNPTAYVFSLAGVSGAIDAAIKECK